MSRLLYLHEDATASELLGSKSRGNDVIGGIGADGYML